MLAATDGVLLAVADGVDETVMVGWLVGERIGAALGADVSEITGLEVGPTPAQVKLPSHNPEQHSLLAVQASPGATQVSYTKPGSSTSAKAT